MVKRNMRIAGTLLAVMLITAGCGAAAGNGGKASSPGAASGSSPAPTSQTAAQTPPATAAGNAGQGKQLFASNCASCHSVGTDKVVGPGLKGIFHKDKLPNGQTLTDANVGQWIKTGDASMPGNPALNSSDLANLVAYLKTL